MRSRKPNTQQQIIITSDLVVNTPDLTVGRLSYKPYCVFTYPDGRERNLDTQERRKFYRLKLHKLSVNCVMYKVMLEMFIEWLDSKVTNYYSPVTGRSTISRTTKPTTIDDLRALNLHTEGGAQPSIDDIEEALS